MSAKTKTPQAPVLDADSINLLERLSNAVAVSGDATLGSSLQLQQATIEYEAAKASVENSLAPATASRSRRFVTSPTPRFVA